MKISEEYFIIEPRSMSTKFSKTKQGFRLMPLLRTHKLFHWFGMIQYISVKYKIKCFPIIFICWTIALLYTLLSSDLDFL